MKDKVKKILAVIGGLVLALVIAELGLRISGYCKTYTEKRNGEYIPANSYNPKNIYWTLPPHTTQTIKTNEFTIARYINSDGFADREFEKRKDSAELRILSLGDSFTYGDGADADSAYPAILQTILAARFPGHKISVYNGGTCGSDPVFGYMAYKHILRNALDPDIIIQAFHTNDIDEDFIIRGGFERYINDSTISFDGVHFKWASLYRYSHLARLFFRNYCGYNEFFINERIWQESVPNDIRIMREVEHRWNEILKPGQKFFFLLHPDRGEIAYDNYIPHFQAVLDGMAPDMGRLQVMDFKRWLLHEYRISKPDLYNIYWKQDGHYNPSGYRLMALSVADGLAPVLAERFK